MKDSLLFYCEAPTVPNGVGVRQDTHPNAIKSVGVTIYTYPSKNNLFMLINWEQAHKPIS